MYIIGQSIITVFKRSNLMILLLVLVVSIGGVSATWMYAVVYADPVDDTIDFTLSVFDYTPEEILPGGSAGEGGGSGNTEVEIGENHYKIIDIVVNTADKGYSLNEAGSLFHSLLKNNRVVYSNQKTSGGNLKFVLTTANNTHRLYYCLQKVDDVTFYIYTFSIDELATASGTEKEIAVYRTTLAKTDIWRATVSYFGYAKTVELSDIGVSTMSQELKYSINVDTWHM